MSAIEMSASQVYDLVRGFDGLIQVDLICFYF
jgi:hypothetical protein